MPRRHLHTERNSHEHPLNAFSSGQRKFVAFDLWPKSDNIQAFYSNEQFKAAFSSLFESVSQPVVQSTDWHAW